MSGGSPSATDAAGIVNYDRLASQLMQCALLVKKGERRNPLLRQTVHDLTDYLTTMPPTSNGATSGTARPASAHTGSTKSGGGGTGGHSSEQQGKEQEQQQASATTATKGGQQSSPTTLSKPTAKAPHIGQVFTKIMGISDEVAADSADIGNRSESSKAATSSKNAARAKADIAAASAAGGRGGGGGSPLSHAAEAVTGWLTGHTHAEEPEWCEEHFAMGCACKARGNKKDGSASTTSKPASSSSASSSRPRSKPAFQRPVNPKSSLIANGWLEQQRRSKMRTVWKDVLASLVEGRRRGEETTLWIQRQIVNSSTGKSELEALHQIPVKWLEIVQYNEYSSDHRFTLKVYNLSDEFIFRCNDEEAAQNWVLTLRSVQQICQQKKTVRTGVDDWDKTQPGSAPSSQRQQQHPPRNSGNATASANSAAARSGTPNQQQPHHRPAAAAAATTTASFEEEKKSDTSAGAAGSQQQAGGHRMPISELRAIAHGEGISTKGMERGELEAVVARIAAGPASSPVPPPPNPAAAKPPHPQAPSSSQPVVPPSASSALDAPSFDEGDRKRKEQQQIDEDAKRYAEELRQRQSAEEERKKQQQDAERQRLLAERVNMERRKREEQEAAARARAAEEERARQGEAERQRLIAERVREQQALEKQRRDEQERRRLEEERLRRDEEEIRRRLAERHAEEQRRKQEEAQRLQQQQWQQQQQAWHKQQAEEAHRRKTAEMQAEQARKQQEEAYRRQQQWQQQQQQNAQQQMPHSGYSREHPAGAYGPQQTPHAHPAGATAHAHPHAQPGHPQQQQQPGYGAAPQGHPHAQQQHYPHTAPHPKSAAQPPPPQRQGSAVNMKYAKMAQQTDDNGQGQQALMTQIKHGILIEWALLPPMLQILRPIEDLLTSVHTVFPPKFGVPGHEYFGKWTPIQLGEISQGPALGNRPDEAKLKKSMRKLRFFLHPDKLPRDLSQEQSFMCKMLWDIISDAEAEYKKKEEELGWIRG